MRRRTFLVSVCMCLSYPAIGNEISLRVSCHAKTINNFVSLMRMSRVPKVRDLLDFFGAENREMEISFRLKSSGKDKSDIEANPRLVESVDKFLSNPETKSELLSIIKTRYADTWRGLGKLAIDYASTAYLLAQIQKLGETTVTYPIQLSTGEVIQFVFGLDEPEIGEIIFPDGRTLSDYALL